MPPPGAHVLVYQFEAWNPTKRAHERTGRYATIDAIRRGLGTPVYDSPIWVPVEDVKDGMYVPPDPPPSRKRE